MPCRCAVGGCNNVPDREMKISVLKFPPAKGRQRSLWTNFVNNTRYGRDSNTWKPTNYSYICSAHFEKDCFKNWSKFVMGYAQHLYLKKGALPTIKSPESTSTSSAEDRPAFRHRQINEVIYYFILCKT